MEKTNKEKKIELLVTCFFVLYILFTCITWAMSTKYNSAPDESTKYYLCDWLSSNKGLPYGTEKEILDDKYGVSYAFQPYLAYIIGSLFIRVFKWFNLNSISYVYAARIFSAICIALYSIVCIKLSKKWFDGLYRYLFILLSTQLPQLLYLGSYINNDSFAILICSLIIYNWVCGIESKWDYKNCIFFGINLGLCALSYYNAYGYILCSVFVFIGSNIINKSGFKELLKKGIIIFLIAFAIAGWWFIRSFILYDGDILGLHIVEKLAYENTDFTPDNYYKIDSLTVLKIWFRDTYCSFIGFFGYMKVRINKIFYKFYKVIFLIGLFGVLLKTILNKLTHKKSEKNLLLLNVIFTISILIPWILSLYYSVTYDYQPQGRYLMPGLIPFMYFITIGFQTIFDIYINNSKIKNILLYTIFIIIFFIPPYVFLSKIIIL